MTTVAAASGLLVVAAGLSAATATAAPATTGARTGSTASAAARTAATGSRYLPALPTYLSPRALPMTPTTGIRVWSEHFRTPRGDAESAYLMSVDLTHGLRVDSWTANDESGSTYLPVDAMARQAHAIAGINADFFDLGTSSGLVDGGIVHAGEVYKTPRPNFDADLYVRADGTAGVGPQPWTGSVKLTPTSRARLTSVNTVTNAASGGITLVNPHVAASRLPFNCTVLRATVVRGGLLRGQRWAVTGVTRTGWTRSSRTLARLTGTQRALVGCGTGGRALATVRRGSTVVVTGGFVNGPLQSLVSGEEQLIANGQPFHDATGHRVTGYHAETFACVARDGRHLLLGAIDQTYWWSAAGITQPQLRNWLLKSHGPACWSAMSLDGGGSTTLVTTDPRTGVMSVVDRPADGAPRWVPDGFFVFRH